MILLNFNFTFIIIHENRDTFRQFKPYEVKIKSHHYGFFYLYMAFQEGFEPPTDSLEGILLFLNCSFFEFW